MEQKHAIEKEHMLLEIEKLEDELQYTKSISKKNATYFTEVNSVNMTKDNEIQQLKRELGDL